MRGLKKFLNWQLKQQHFELEPEDQDKKSQALVDYMPIDSWAFISKQAPGDSSKLENTFKPCNI